MLVKLWAFALGVFSVAFWPALPDGQWLVAVAFPVIAGLCFPASRVPAAIALGCLYGCLWGAMQTAGTLPVSLDKTDYRVTGTVKGMPERNSRRVRFLFDVESAQAIDGGPVQSLRRLRISWYGAPAVAPGQHWTLRVRLRAPRGFANPGGFDYQRWLLGEGISATGYVRDHRENRLLAQGGPCLLDCWRWTLASAIGELPVAPVARSFMTALVLGDSSRIPASVWGQLVATGTVHLLVVSGLHIGMVAGFGFILGFALGRLAAAAGSTVPAPIIAALSAMVLAVFYGALAGFGLPVQRALAMTATVLGAALLRRRVSPWQGFALALAVIALIDPLAATRAGFWLSFTAVAGLLAWFVPRPRRRFRMLEAQWVVFAALAVGLLAYQGHVSPVAPVVNLVAVPWISVSVVPACLLGIVSGPLWPAGRHLAWQFASWQLDWAADLLEWLAPLAAGWTWQPALAADPAFLAGVALVAIAVVLPAGLGLRVPAVVIVGALVMATPPPAPDLALTVLDVGQGLAIVVRAGKRVLVYDPGPRYSPRFDAGSAIVAPYLRHLGIARVDRLVVSHGDSDHAGGLSGLLDQIGVSRVITGEPALDFPGDRRAQRCQAGQGWQWGDVTFSILHPGTGTPANDNNRSCVILVERGGSRILLTGDIEASVERELVRAGLLRKPVDVLIAPHHGSKTSSSVGFIKAVSPTHVVFSAGFNHHFGHPHETVRARYRAEGSRPWSTAKSGAITFTWEGDQGPVMREYRRRYRRYWH